MVLDFWGLPGGVEESEQTLNCDDERCLVDALMDKLDAVTEPRAFGVKPT